MFRTAFDHFVDVVFQAMDNGRIIFSLEGIEAYFDESGTHTGSPLFIVAGYISTETLWKKFRRLWASFLESHCDGEEYFHATDRIGNTEGRVSRKAVSIIHKCIVCGLAVTMRQSDFDDLATPILVKDCGDVYDFCCQAVYDAIMRIPEVQELPGEILYIFEQGGPNWKRARSRMEKIQLSASLKKRFRYRNHAFMTKAEAPPLQAADFFSNLLFKTYRDNGGFAVETLHPALRRLFESSHRHQHFDRLELRKMLFNSLAFIDNKRGTKLAEQLRGWYPSEETPWADCWINSEALGLPAPPSGDRAA